MAKEANQKNRVTFQELFEDPRALELKHLLPHSNVHVPGGGTETSLVASKPGLRDLKMVYHPDYGIIGSSKGRYWVIPSHNMQIGRETEEFK